MVSKFILRCHLGDVLKNRGIPVLKLSKEINCPLPTLNDLINNKHMDSRQIPAQLIANLCAYFDLAPNKLFSVEKKRNFMKPYRKKYYVYPAIFNYADDGISVKFPDLPGCLTFGYSDEEACAHSVWTPPPSQRRHQKFYDYRQPFFSSPLNTPLCFSSTPVKS